MVNSIDHARQLAAPMFQDPAVESVNVDSWIGPLRVYRDGTVKLVDGHKLPSAAVVEARVK